MADQKAAQIGKGCGGCLGLIVLAFFGYALITGLFTSGKDATPLASLSKVSQEDISYVLVAFNAVGCGKLPEDDAETLLTVALDSVFRDDKAAGRAVGTSYPLVYQAKSNGEVEAQTMMGCTFFSNRDQVSLIHMEVLVAKAYLESAATMPPDTTVPGAVPSQAAPAPSVAPTDENSSTVGQPSAPDGNASSEPLKQQETRDVMTGKAAQSAAQTAANSALAAGKSKDEAWALAIAAAGKEAAAFELANGGTEYQANEASAQAESAVRDMAAKQGSSPTEGN